MPPEEEPPKPKGEWRGEIEEEDPKPEQKPLISKAPTPWIVNLDESGKLVIAFDMPMRIPDDISELRSEKVGIRRRKL